MPDLTPMSESPSLVERLNEPLTVDTTDIMSLAPVLRRMLVERAEAATALHRLRNADARSVSRGKHLIKVRDALINLKLEDEGDRVYFESSNHADDFKGVVAGLDAFKWDRYIEEKDEEDVIENCRLANERADKAEAALAEAATRIAALEAALGKGLACVEESTEFKIGNPALEQAQAAMRAALSGSGMVAEEETEAEKVIRAAWKIISRLEERAVEDTMYDGRPVEEWCDRAVKFLGRDSLPASPAPDQPEKET